MWTFELCHFRTRHKTGVALALHWRWFSSPPLNSTLYEVICGYFVCLWSERARAHNSGSAVVNWRWSWPDPTQSGRQSVTAACATNTHHTTVVCATWFWCMLNVAANIHNNNTKCRTVCWRPSVRGPWRISQTIYTHRTIQSETTSHQPLLLMSYLLAFACKLLHITKATNIELPNHLLLGPCSAGVPCLMY